MKSILTGRPKIYQKMKSNKNSEEDEFLDQNKYFSNFPPYTKWESRGTFFGLQKGYIPGIKKTFLNHWEVSLCMPITVISIIYSSYFIYLLDFFLILSFSWKSFLVMLIFLILYTISYFQVIIEGPGYLPYYFPNPPPKLNNLKNNEKDYLSGVAATQEQIDYAKSNIHIPRTHFFKSARRVVIRGDHFCEWCACFIGKKNYKLFFLFNFWGSLYIGYFGYSIINAIIKSVNFKNPNVFMLIMNMLYTVIVVFFFIFQMYFILDSLKSIWTDVRDYESLIKDKKDPVIMSKRKQIKKSKLELFEEVFGNRSQWYLWLIPIGAYHNIDDVSLIENINENDYNNNNQWLL